MKKTKLFSLLSLSALLVACGDPIASSSIPSEVASSSSETTSRLLVSEMMEDMNAGNYTMTFSMEDIDIYYYEVAIPLIYGSLFNPEVNESIAFYLDLTIDESPVMYTQTETNQWVVAPLDPFFGFAFLAPLSYLDPTQIDDAWFTFDELEGVYVLDADHFNDLFTGVESTDEMDYVTIQGDPATGEILIMVTSVDPYDSSVTQTVVISYTDVGTTQVSLPTDLMDYPSYFLDTILASSTNHSFLYSIEEMVPQPDENLLVKEILGQRDEGEYLLTDYETFDQTYVNALEDGTFEQLTSTLGSTTKTVIDETTYTGFVNDFYPLKVLELDKTWIDLQQPTLNPELNVAMYPLRPEAMGELIHDPFLDGATNLMGSVLFYESAFTGPLVNIVLEFEKNATFYQADFTLLYFDFTTIYPPYIPETADFFAIFDSIQTVQNYHLSQTVSEGNAYLNTFLGSRDGANFEISDVNQPTNPSNYFEWDGMNYIQWTFDDAESMYTYLIVDEATYRAGTTDLFYLDLDAIDPQDIVADTSWEGYRLDPSVYDTVVSEDLLAEYTIENVYFNAFGSLDEFASVYVTIEAINTTTSTSANFLISLSSIESTHLTLPGDSIDTDLITLDSFQSLHNEGITSTLGTLFRSNDDETDASFLYFGMNETSAAWIDPMALESEQVDLWVLNNTQLYDHYTGALGTPLTNPVVEIEDDFLAFQNTLPSFDVNALTSQDVSMSTMVPFLGGYEVEATFIEQHSENILLEGDVIQSAYLMLTETDLSLSIHVVNNNVDYFIEFELTAINEAFDLKDLIESAQP